ncbi:dTDP-4-dehydrorhamnose 3,5-epimerase [Allorhizocola rhizosphaerae]|uniref:dTDP-4-dehydrorhamnose 3,5-epimerase n=1 Tax=Allorhizocola rhizosphaerae TaxID=1872709 RepID=UPI000E3C95AA|nr:dTDP-4-dehydrorhamnose 3,5-epimerase [Allorhizocola rhizosphaerae]
MKIRPLSIDGAFEMSPQQHSDDRGAVMEWYRQDLFAEVVGHPLHLAQSNLSVSRRGVIRGIHFAEVPPGQAKYVSCLRGAGVDVVVDLRVGSPTFGRWEMVALDDTNRKSIYIAEGLGHGFCATTDDATLIYMCSAPYTPAREHIVNALDPELGIDWPTKNPILSQRDTAAPGLAEVARSGLLPRYEDCLAYTAKLRSDHE